MPSPYYRSRPADYSGIEEGLGSIAKLFAPPSMQDQYLAMKALDLKDERERKAASIADYLSRGGDPNAVNLLNMGVSDPGKFQLSNEAYKRATAPGATPQGLDPVVYAIHGNYGNTAAGATQAQGAARQLESMKPVGANETRFYTPALQNELGTPPVQRGAVLVGQGQEMVLPGAQGSSMMSDEAQRILGPRKPRTMDEVKGDALAKQPENVQAEAALGNIPVVEVQREGGTGTEYVRQPNAVGRTPATSKDDPYTKLVAQDMVKLGTELFTNASKSVNEIGNLNQMDALIKASAGDQGKWATVKNEARRALNALGIEGGDTSPIETLQAMGNKFALALRDPSSGAGMPGALSDSDRQFLESMSPGANRSPQANQRLVDIYRRVHENNIAINDLRQSYLDRNGGKLDEGFRKEVIDYLKQRAASAGDSLGLKKLSGGDVSAAAPAPGGSVGAAAPPPGATAAVPAATPPGATPPATPTPTITREEAIAELRRRGRL